MIERGHAVATEGPYRFIRHPGYTAIILFMLAMPVSLGSVWGLLPAGIEAVLIIVRTVFEDRFLHDELEGYPAYAQRVRYRLLPGVW
ncbi:MAG: isoprenylcysteine carboxylmethyltransferase family protein [Planctomycetota bacterium]